MKTSHRLLALLLPAALSGCSSQGPGSGQDAASGSPDFSGTAPDFSTPDAATRAGERTLANCPTSIDPNAPAFFKNYFLCLNISMNGTSVVLSTQDLPPHRTSYYGAASPNYTAFDTRGGQYHANPNTLSASSGTITIPANPVSRGLTITATLVDGTAGDSPNEYPMGAAGVALDSVHLYNDLAAPPMTLANEQFTFDTYNAHPAPGGDYHYHSASPGPLEVLQRKGLVTTSAPGSAQIELYGIMCDGTVVLGCKELDGSGPQTNNLDAQNGHTHDLKDQSGAVLFSGRYHTHICPGTIGTHAYTPEIQFYTTCIRG